MRLDPPVYALDPVDRERAIGRIPVAAAPRSRMLVTTTRDDTYN